MGVPALFRWLSKKYPKIVLNVEEEEQTKVTDQDGMDVAVPIDISKPNPNGQEFDNLYLDMNGIVHPCTHPEGKPAPETEEDMMLEIFQYTERVVNMIRPRKLLLMAIDGVAPRAKMNQQRSRRFRSAQEAKEKEEERKENIAAWEAMGKTITDTERNKTAWDSNAITPGTPFMDLLAQSLRYWVVQKANTDPGWANLQVIISDASVPGEGEHKIMDFIRRQRTNSGYDPNTRHVIYGLDADLIMLSLATHEPHFRVLREDVFFNDTSSTACRLCGQEGHYAAQCKGEKKEKVDENDTQKKPVTKKPFIFLDVSILREYLDAELNIATTTFTFDLERAIDDWVMLIFFVGNDFLPHLPSLEIREGAIDTLLKIWKNELPRMGGYVTEHGRLNFTRLQVILTGLAGREDEIFRRRKEAEDRQDQNAKRRKLEANREGGSYVPVKPSSALQLASNPAPPSSTPAAPMRHALPPRPNFDSFEGNANALGFGAVSPTTVGNQAAAITGITGSAHDWVANRKAIRMANMSAAEMLKAEMMAATPMAKPRSTASPPVISPIIESLPTPPVLLNEAISSPTTPSPQDIKAVIETTTSVAVELAVATAPETEPTSPQGAKRKHEELEKDDEKAEDEADDTFTVDPDLDDVEDAPGDTAEVVPKRIVNNNGTVEQEDTVKLWEAGYKERYYRQKFGVELSDMEFRKKLTTCYVEGLAWVLHYYYQGTPSWVWYYPYHFAPFAADFQEVDKMEIKFTIGQPFKPFEQLMGVFPPASRKHIPEVFQDLMTNEDSPILDFYPESFEIDMNGKKMAWQGVALLPFIDEKRLLDAMATRYPQLSEDEVKRNGWGSNALYITESHPLFPTVEGLYAKRKKKDPTPIDPAQNHGHSGSLLPDPTCIPGSTYYCPISSTGLPDIPADRSISALYYFPKQLRPHRSELLSGVRHPARILSYDDIDIVRRGGRGRGHPRDNGHYGPGRGGYQNGSVNGHGRGSSYGGNTWDRDRDGGHRGGGRGMGGSSYGGPPPPRSYQPTPTGGYGRGPNQHQGGGYGRDSSSYYGGSQGGNHGGNQGYGGYNSGYGGRGGGGGGGGGNSSGGYGGYGGYGGSYGSSRGDSSSGGSAGYGGYGGQGYGGSGGYNGGGGGGGYGGYSGSGGGRGGGGGGGGYGGYGQHQGSYNAPSRGRGRGGYDRY